MNQADPTLGTYENIEVTVTINIVYVKRCDGVVDNNVDERLSVFDSLRTITGLCVTVLDFTLMPYTQLIAPGKNDVITPIAIHIGRRGESIARIPRQIKLMGIGSPPSLR